MRLTPAIISVTTGRTPKKVQSHPSQSVADLKNNLEAVQNSAGGSIPPPRPMQRDKWWREQDGFLATNVWGIQSEGSNDIVPIIWLQEEKMQMCIYQNKQLTLVLLTPESHAALGGTHFQTQILEKV
jgi:hypothetical protein